MCGSDGGGKPPGSTACHLGSVMTCPEVNPICYKSCSDPLIFTPFVDEAGCRRQQQLAGCGAGGGGGGGGGSPMGQDPICAKGCGGDWIICPIKKAIAGCGGGDACGPIPIPCSLTALIVLGVFAFVVILKIR